MARTTATMIAEIDSAYYTLADAAGLLGKKTDTLKKWFARGCPHRKNGVRYEVKISEVFEWRLQHEREILLGGNDGPVELLNLEQERARLAKEQRLEKEMNNARLRGELVDADEVEQVWSARIMAAKVKLLALGSEIAEGLGVPNRRQVAEEINKEVRAALRELANDGSSGTDRESLEEV